MFFKYFNATQILHKAIISIGSLLVLMTLNVNALAETGDIESSGLAATSVLRSAGSGTDAVNAGYMAQLVIGLFIVLLCIVALAWIAKRLNHMRSTPDGSLRVLGGLSMGARERVVLVQVGNRQLLLGVAPGRINTLHVLEEALESGSDISAQPSNKGFAEKLSAALSRNHR